MAHVSPRTDFNRSRLIRLLSELALIDADAPGHTVAERLGEWLNVADAITLFAAHQTAAAAPPPPATLPADAGLTTPAAAAAELARVRTALTQAILSSCTPGAGETRIKWPVPQAGVPLEIAADYEPYRRFHLAHQRDLEFHLRPLRLALRTALGNASAPLAGLAAIDGAFDTILAEREGRLLAGLPGLMKKRFEQRRAAHLATLQAEGGTLQDDAPARWLAADGWLTHFCKEMQAVLLAELELRLQPAIGLMEAFSNEVSQYK